MVDDNLDAINEMVNIGVGRAAQSLNLLIHTHIQLSVPKTKILLPSEIPDELKAENIDNNISQVKISFDGPIVGNASLLFDEKDAQYLVDSLLTDDLFETEELDGLKIGVLVEVGNIVLNGVLGVLGNVFKEQLHFQVPTFDDSLTDNNFLDFETQKNSKIIMNTVHFDIPELKIKGEIILLFEVTPLDRIVTCFKEFNKDKFNEAS
jgi:chemotaxis protein CheC